MNPARVKGIDGDLFLGEEVVDIHEAMDVGHIGRYQCGAGINVASVPGDQEVSWDLRNNPDEVFAAVDAGDVGGDLVEAGDGDGFAVDGGGYPFHVELVDDSCGGGAVGGEALEESQSLAGRELEEGDLSALGHETEIIGDVFLCPLHDGRWGAQ